MAPLFENFPASLSISLYTISASPRIFIFGVFCLYFIARSARAIHKAFITPLGRIPGPLSCKISGIPDAYYAVVEGSRSEWIHSLYEKYGKISCRTSS